MTAKCCLLNKGSYTLKMVDGAEIFVKSCLLYRLVGIKFLNKSINANFSKELLEVWVESDWPIVLILKFSPFLKRRISSAFFHASALVIIWLKDFFMTFLAMICSYFIDDKHWTESSRLMSLLVNAALTLNRVFLYLHVINQLTQQFCEYLNVLFCRYYRPTFFDLFFSTLEHNATKRDG